MNFSIFFQGKQIVGTISYLICFLYEKKYVGDLIPLHEIHGNKVKVGYVAANFSRMLVPLRFTNV
jgi:hypothetical protein